MHVQLLSVRLVCSPLDDQVVVSLRKIEKFKVAPSRVTIAPIVSPLNPRSSTRAPTSWAWSSASSTLPLTEYVRPGPLAADRFGAFCAARGGQNRAKILIRQAREKM